MNPLLKRIQSTLLGRLKTRSILELTNSEDLLPTDKEFFEEVFKRWKANPLSGEFYFRLLNRTEIYSTSFAASYPRKTSQKILDDLNRSEYFEQIYAEGQAKGLSGKPIVGCLILGHRTKDSPGYYAAIYYDDSPDHCSFLSFVPRTKRRPFHLAIQSTNGWMDIAAEDLANCAPAQIMLGTFRAHLNSVSERKLRPGMKIPEKEIHEPPHDSELILRLRDAGRGKVRITTAIASIEEIVPHSFDHCLNFPKKIINQFERRIRSGYRPTLLVYWNASHFVMSDDYVCYLAYKSTNTTEVPVAILGEFPLHAASPQKSGGIELLPPISISSDFADTEPPSEEFKIWQLEQKLKDNSKKSIPSTMIATWMIFARMLNDSELNERDLHDFVFENPLILTAYGISIQSEVRLGNTYRIDLVIRKGGLQEQVTLIELEHHRHEIFTASGQPRAEITHAIQQVQDWIRWLRENPTDPFTLSLDGIPPKGLVVAGRSKDFIDDHRSRLAHLNSNNFVTVITYDELLDRLRDLILARLD